MPLTKKTKLRGNYGIVTATALVVANMIGAGIFTTSGLMATHLPGPGWVILCWLFGGLIAISGALCYAELSTRMPECGGEYVFLKRLYHPILGFLTGWTSFFVGFSVPIALSAIAFAAYLFSSLSRYLIEINPAQLAFYQKATAIGIISVFTALHYVGARLGGRIQNLLTGIKIFLILGLTSVGLIFGEGNWSNIYFKPESSIEGMAFGTSMMMVMFAYSGWNASSYIAGELKKPKKTLPVSLISGTIIVIVLYIAINLFIFYSTPYSELRGTITVVERASVQAFGSWVANLISGIVAIMLLSSIGAFLLIGPRVYYAMAKDRLFFSFASKMHPRYKVPSKSVMLQGLIAMLMVVIGSFEQLLVYIGFALGIFPWLAIAGLFKARKLNIGEETAVKVMAYPLTPLFFLVSILALMIVTYFNKPIESSIAVLTVIIGIPCYYIWVKSVKIFDKKKN